MIIKTKSDLFDKDKYRQIDKDLLFDYLVNINSINTAKARKSNVKIFFNFTKKHLNEKPIQEISRTDILSSRNFLQGSVNNPSIIYAAKCVGLEENQLCFADKMT